MGAGPKANYELLLVNDHLIDPPVHGQALAAVFDTGSADHPFNAMHRKQPGDRLIDKDLLPGRIQKKKQNFER